MSTNNNLDKTFSRKNTNKPNKSKHKQNKPSQSHQHQNNGNPPTTIIYALMSPKNSDNNTTIKKKKKKKEQKMEIKDETQEIKQKKDETREIKQKKDETLKLIIKRKSIDDIKLKDLKKSKKEENCECSFPISRVLRIIKSEGSQYKLSGEAVFLINKATEKFIELFTGDAYDIAVKENKNFVAYKHLASVVSKEKRMDFLSDFVPEKVTAEKALAEVKPAETLPG